MMTSGSVTVHFPEGDFRYSAGIGREDFLFLVLDRGNYRIEGRLNWSGVSGPLFLISSGAGPLLIQGRGAGGMLTVSSPQIDSLLDTSYGGRLIRTIGNVRDGGIPCFRLNAREMAGLKEKFRIIGEEAEYGETEWEQVVQLHLLEIFLLLGRLTPLPDRERALFEGEPAVWTVPYAAEYLKNHYDDSFTLDDLASRCALNASYFSRAFKAYAGVPLFEFINRLRIERACGLLRDTDRTVLDIALTVGYNNVSFFNRYFRRLLRLSPGEYRKRARL